MKGNIETKKRKIEHWQVVTLLLMGYDFLAVIMSYFLALWIRFDCEFSEIDLPYLHTYYRTILIYALFCVAIFGALRLYKSIWRFASYTELLRMIYATVITEGIYCVVVNVLIMRMPVSYYLFGFLIQFILTLGVRFSYRFILLLRGRKNSDIRQKRVMIIGAGEAGQMILRDIKTSKEVNKKVCCFIDDNPNKWGRYIDNVPIFGGRDSIMEAVKKYDIEKIYVAIPSAKAEDKREILHICSETHCDLMNLPGLYQLYTGELLVSKMKPVQIEDLLGRDPIKADMTEVFEYIQGKVVLVTGVGSIGSELARQIAAHNPKHLILFDIYENNAYDIQLELMRKYPELKLDTIIGSVRDSRKIFQVFEQYRPDIVYHDVEIGDCCHINAGAIVKAGGKVEHYRKLEAGEVVLGYESAIVTADSNSEFAKEYEAVPEEPETPETPAESNPPKSDAPKTGDNTNLMLWLLLFGTGLCGLGASVALKFYRKKNK